MKDQTIEGILTAALVALCFLLIVMWAGKSMEFQKACDTACAGRAAITPVLGGQEVCLCEQGSGIWTRQYLQTR